MKGYYGYIMTMVGLIASIALLMILNRENIGDSDISTFLLLVVLSGFAGGFIAPYHVIKNSFRSSATVVVVVLIPILLLAQFTNEINLDTPDFGDTLGYIFVLILLLVLIIGTVIVLVVLFISGLVGSIFGRFVFKPEQFDDYLPDYVQSYSVNTGS